MRADERLGLAHLSYQRAIASARAQSTPTTWRRLLTAAANLNAAKRERAEERARGQAGRVRRTPRGPALLAGGAGEAPSRGAPPLAQPSQGWTVLLERARAHALISWSLKLIAESRAPR